MGFLSSIYLWLIPLSMLPLLIHLFYNRRYHLVEFSTIKFLKDLEIDSMKRIHIIEWLLLLIRTLIILFLILMLSRPIIKSNSFESYFKSSESIYSIIAIDDSFSMTRTDKTVYLKDIFSNKIKSIVETLPDKSRLSIIRLSDHKVIFEGIKNEYFSKILVGKMGQGKIDFFPFINSIEEKGENINREIHILSDLQDYSFLGVHDNSLDGWNVFIHEMNYINDNLSITSLDIKNDIIALNKELQIDVTIQNNGLENARNALLILNIDKLNVGQQQIDLNSGESSTYSFFTVLSSPGEHIGRIDLIYDDFDADNIYSFNLSLPENITIGFLGATREDFFFIENSLKAFNDNLKNLSITYSNQILSNENFLIDNNVSFIFGYNYITDNNLESSVIESLNNGNSIYIFPSNNEITREIKPDFFDFISMNSSKIDFKEYRDNNSIKILSKNLINLELLNILGGSKIPKDHVYMDLYKFFTFPSDHKANILIDGMSIWNTYSISNGNVEVLGILPKLEWTNFPIKPSFISWIDYCITHNLNNSNITYEIGDKYDSFTSDYTVTLPDSRKYEYRANSDKLFKFTLRGNHSIEKDGIDQTIIVNPSLDELYFNKISNQKLNELFSNIFIFNLDDKMYNKIEEARIGIELWKYFLYLVIILILIEMVISNQFFRRN